MVKKLRAWMIVYQECELIGGTAKLYDGIQVNEFPGSNDIIRALKTLKPQKYSFQLEKGSAGRKHYQIFIVLDTAMSGREIRESCKSILRRFWKAGCMTTLPLHSQDDSEIYCQKEETRIEGPWFFPKNKYFGQDMVTKRKLYPWQRSVIAMALAKKVDPRSIIYIAEEQGGKGKSEVTKHLGYHHDACVVPLGLSSAQMKAAICSTHARRNYIVDLPRNNRSYQDIYDTIEEIKRGFVISSFHGKLKNLFFERPNVFVFSNSLPELYRMSFDMWTIYTIDSETRELKRLNKWEILSYQKEDKENRTQRSICSFIEGQPRA